MKRLKNKIADVEFTILIMLSPYFKIISVYRLNYAFLPNEIQEKEHSTDFWSIQMIFYCNSRTYNVFVTVIYNLEKTHR